MRVLPFSDE